MKLKDGVSLEGVQWQMFYAAVKVEAAYNKLGHDLTITAGTDGKHAAKSLHYKGLALDIRSRTISAGTKPKLLKAIRLSLGPDYQVIDELDHWHVEWDPK